MFLPCIPYQVEARETGCQTVATARYYGPSRAIRLFFSSCPLPSFIKPHRPSEDVAYSTDLASIDGIPPEGLATRILGLSRGLSPANHSGNRKWNIFIESSGCLSGCIMGDEGHHGDAQYRL
jgi:hypothetical protein